jgi:Rieske Fe-S protein
MTPSAGTDYPGAPLTPESAIASDAKGRRNFLTEALAVAVGAFVGLVPFVAGLVVFLDPLRRRSAAGEFIRIASLDSLSDNGAPRQFPVVADRSDAWNLYQAQPLGSVFLRRTEGKIEALNAVCPHLGCMVDFVGARDIFRCPCHNSLFEPDGARIIPPGGQCPSPRALDTLEAEVRGEGSAAMVWVKFENFRAGTPEKIPEA